MRTLRLLLSLFLLLPAAFFAFGFLASFEPVPHAIAWRLGYGALFVASIAASGMLALAALRGRSAGMNLRATGVT